MSGLCKTARLFVWGRVLWIFTLIAHSYCLVRKGLYSILRRTNRPPRPGDTSVSCVWLQNVLQRTNRVKKGTNILPQVEVESLSGNRGLAGVMNRVKVVYGYNSSNENPTSFILKMSNTHNNFGARKSIIAGGGGREALFYSSSIARSIRSGGLPGVIYSYGSRVLGEYVMLMEDLKLRNPNATGVNFMFGNQCWGIPTDMDIPKRDPLDVLRLMYSRAAEIHAAFWRDPSLLKQKWLKGAAWYNGKGRAQWELAIERGRLAWLAGKKRAAESKTLKFSSKLVEVIDSSFQGIPFIVSFFSIVFLFVLLFLSSFPFLSFPFYRFRFLSLFLVLFAFFPLYRFSLSFSLLIFIFHPEQRLHGLRCKNI